MEIINQNKKSDTDPEILEWYKKIYSGEDGLSCYFNLQKFDGNIRPYAMTRENIFLDDNANKMEVSGDIIFNFSTSSNGKSRYDLLKKYIEEINDDDLKNIYLKKLDYCKNHNCDPENCALMPKTGNLQGAKQGIGYDRGDTYIWSLNEYFENGVEIIFNHATYQNKLILISYLETLRKPGKNKSIYNYCKLFFNIIDTRLIDELIELGSKTIDSELRARRYIDLALKFWEKRNKYFNTLNKLQ